MRQANFLREPCRREGVGEASAEHRKEGRLSCRPPWESGDFLASPPEGKEQAIGYIHSRMKRANKEGELSAEWDRGAKGWSQGEFGPPDYRDTGGSRVRRASRPAVTT